MNPQKERHYSEEKVVDLQVLLSQLWIRRYKVIIISLVSGIIGLLITLIIPKEYEAVSVLIPENIGQESGSLSKSLGGIAAIAGFDLNSLESQSNVFNPMLYESLAQSTPFLLELLNTSFYFDEVEKEITVRTYYLDYHRKSLSNYVINFPYLIISLVYSFEENAEIVGRNNALIKINEDDAKAISDLQERIQVAVDWELATVNIKVEFRDSEVTALINDFTKNYITDYVTQYSISKTQAQLSSLMLQLENVKSQFEVAQQNLAKFRDSNQFINTSSAKTEEERLLAEYNLAFGVYSQITQEREALMLKLQEQKPVFTTLEPVIVPIEESSPSIFTNIIGFAFLGGFSYISLVVFSNRNIIIR